MTIRLVSERDRNDWLALRRAFWPESDPARHASDVDITLGGGGPLAAVFVHARPEGGLGGFLELSVRGYAEGNRFAPVPYVEAWFVAPELRDQGVGRALMAAAEAWARRAGYKIMGSDSSLDNPGGQAAHRAVGFREVERSVHFLKSLDDS